ncbi:zinc finger protein 271-like isoform X1 [Alosa sapidissima]|uniref:zinc finger protein 271-like isoform X1 n=2 Tax=Alosa sapidissima TaxID=34773 RepID=UPI001C08A8BC|nr:zinc finger protein 271-like isoform X1 [Alosa sapidissima]
MDASTGHALLLEQRQREVDSLLSDQMESNLLLRIQVEDLQKRLDEKENKLTHAQETISALRNEVQSLQEQLAFEKRKHQKPQSLRSRHVRAKIEAKTLVCRDPPSADLSCRTGFSPTDPSCNDITEGLARSQNVVSHNLPIMSENWPLPWRARTNDVCVDQPTIFLSCVVEPNLTQSSSFGRNRARSPQQCPVKTLLVSIEDCRHKLGPDGVFKLLDRKDAEEEEEADVFDEGSNHKHKNEDLFSGMEDSFLVKHKEERMNGLYCCSQCSRRFSKPILLNLHLKMHGISQVKYSGDSGRPSHSKEKTTERLYSCNLCSKTFSQSNHLKLHQRTHRSHVESQQHIKDRQQTLQKVSYACDQCSKTFSRINYLTLHQRRHKRSMESSAPIKDAKELNREISHACDQCSKTFSQINYLRLHQTMHIRPPESPVPNEDVKRKPIWKITYPCDQCNKVFSQINYLRLHQKVHGKSLSFQIPCSNKEQAQKKKKMSSNTPPRCGTCGKVFSSRAYLKVHQRVHTNEKPYACVVCDRTFATSSNLYTHQRTRHKGQSSTCGECGRSFPCLSQEKPIACASCSAARKVRLLGKLQEHLRQRAQDKPHQCPRCPMRFASASGARSHERSHAGERPLRLVELRSEVRSVC